MSIKEMTENQEKLFLKFCKDSGIDLFKDPITGKIYMQGKNVSSTEEVFQRAFAQ